MKRGEIRWYTFQLPDKRRPVLILTRDEVLDRLNEIMLDRGDIGSAYHGERSSQSGGDPQPH